MEVSVFVIIFISLILLRSAHTAVLSSIEANPEISSDLRLSRHSTQQPKIEDLGQCTSASEGRRGHVHEQVKWCSPSLTVEKELKLERSSEDKCD